MPLAAGDSANDVGMLKAAGFGCCMANGSDGQGSRRPHHRGCAGGRPCRPHRGAVVRRPPRGALRPRLGSPWGKIESAAESMSFAPVYNEHSRALILGHMAQPQKPGDGLLLRPSAKPLLAHAGGADRGACARPGGHRSEKADDPAPRAGPVGYAGKLYHHRRVGCVHPGRGAQ